jgi:hypothetical protein
MSELSKVIESSKFVDLGQIVSLSQPVSFGQPVPMGSFIEFGKFVDISKQSVISPELVNLISVGEKEKAYANLKQAASAALGFFTDNFDDANKMWNTKYQNSLKKSGTPDYYAKYSAFVTSFFTTENAPKTAEALALLALDPVMEAGALGGTIKTGTEIGKLAEGTENIGYSILEKIPANSANKSFFEGAKYSDIVEGKMKIGDFHSFPEEVKLFEKNGTITNIKGGDGIIRQLLKIPGDYGGKKGFFEFVKEADGTITHRLFRPN